jgi:hypothetical protein
MMHKKQISVRNFSLMVAMVLQLGGCQLLGGLQVETLAHQARPPGQVAAYVSVTEGDAGIAQLQRDNFHVYEDGKALNADDVQLRLLDRTQAATHHAMLLVDLSGKIEEPGRRGLLVQQLTPFVERLRSRYDVSVYGYDGGEKLYPFGKFARSSSDNTTTTAVKQALDALTHHRQRDSSSNLNGALLAAIAQLDYNLKRSNKTIRIGSLIVLARGPDLAGRTSEDRRNEVLDQTSHHLFALTPSGEQNEELAEQIGKQGAVQASSFDNMESELGELAVMLEEDYEHYYLVSYCSPSRAGERTLLLEVKRSDSDGSEEKGSVELKFSAAGFGSGCNPDSIPRFPLASAPASTRPTTTVSTPTDGTSVQPAATADSADASSEPAPGTDDTQSPEANSPSAGSSDEPAPPAEPSDGAGGPEEGVVPPPQRPGYAP